MSTFCLFQAVYSSSLKTSPRLKQISPSTQGLPTTFKRAMREHLPVWTRPAWQEYLSPAVLLYF